MKLKNLITETGIRDIHKITQGKKWVDIYFHEDLDGVVTAIAMKKYLENYGIKIRECYTIQYGNEYKVKKASTEPDVMTALVDFANGKLGFTIHVDHHSGDHSGGDPLTKTHFRKSPSNLETMSGVISPTDIFPPGDVKWINMIDSADFTTYNVKPQELVTSKPEFGDNTDENRKKMLLATNRILLVYKDKNNLMTDTVKQAQPSIVNLYQTVKSLSKGFKDIDKIDANAKRFQKGIKSQKAIEYFDNGLLVMKMMGVGGGTGAYDRYAVFKAYPKSIMKIQQFSGMIQVAKNPFKKSDIDIQGIVSGILDKYKKYLEPLSVGIAKLKGINAHGEMEDRMGFTYKDLDAQYHGNIKGLTPENEAQLKQVYDKPYPNITDEEKDWLNNTFTVSVWDIVNHSSGGHPSIYNISGLNMIKTEIEKKLHIKEKLMNDLISSFNDELNKKSLNEIRPSGRNATIDPIDSMGDLLIPSDKRDSYGDRKQKVKITPAIAHKIKKYKGYRFLIYTNSDGLDGNNDILFMLMPDRNFVIGVIEYSDMNFGEFGRIKQVQYSSVHKKFRGQGLGKIMYGYFVNAFPVVASDGTLFGGSFKIWSSMDKYFGGVLFGYVGEVDEDSDYNEPSDKIYVLSDTKGKSRSNSIGRTDHFIYVNKKVNIPKSALIKLTIESKLPKVATKFMTRDSEVNFLKAMKNFNETNDYGYRDFDDEIFDDMTDYRSGSKFIVYDLMYTFIYVVKYTELDNSDEDDYLAAKIEVVDILKSKKKGINKV